MIDLLVEHGGNDDALLAALAAHEREVLASARRGDREQVRHAEAIVQSDPAGAFTFDVSGNARLTVAERTWGAGRFEVLSLAALRGRAGTSVHPARLRLWVVDGGAPATDIGSLQAHAGAGTLFQVASQFNCLESIGPWIRPVGDYFDDSTQGPRASISAFAGTLLRHYQAPSGDDRFLQTDQGRQVELLADVCGPGLATVCNGYLLAEDIVDARAFAAVLEARFDKIRVGVHADVEVGLGYDWDGAVRSPPRIAQVFTSTVAAGGYGRLSDDLLAVCRPLLRAAYLGTLLSAVAVGCRRVVLTLIGGGVFGNPLPLIWEAILCALDEVGPLLTRELDVVVNGRNLGPYLARPTLVEAAHQRGGALLVWPRGGPPRLHR